MKVKVRRRYFTAFALALCLAALALGYASEAAGVASAADCQGDACSQVTVTFDDAKQQYNAQNNSADRWVAVSASNLGAAANACIAPGTSERLALKSIVGAYHADRAEPRCGAPDNYGSPPAADRGR